MAFYRTIREIGRGGFGVVEEVAADNGARYARKTFAPNILVTAQDLEKLRKRFIREVLTQQELGGNEIIPVVDHELSGDEPWFTMPLAEKSYGEQIRTDKTNGYVEIDPIADILNALQYLHELGYVHRDLNPNNILLHDGHWKLSDFGAVLPPSGQTVTLTDATVIFTERYCSPEQRRDFHRAQAASDVYSFGCILHDIFGTHERTPYAKYSAPGGIGIVIEKCTDTTPSKRPSVKVLRGLVLDTLVEEGGHCKVEDAQSQQWLSRLDNISAWREEDFDEFARYFASLDLHERNAGHEGDWVFSLSTPFLTRLPEAALQKIVERRDGTAEAIVEKYCEWARTTRFLFHFSDTVCDRLVAIFEHGTPPMKAVSFMALVRLGHSHNRWYIMRSMFVLCQHEQVSKEIGRRLAIELKTEQQEYAFRDCLRIVGIDKATLSPDLAKLC